MTPQDLDALEKLADEATPGPWIEDKGGNLRTYGISFKNDGGYRVPIINWHGVSRPASADGAANAAFIAAANPATIKALIAELKAAHDMARDMAIFRPGEATPDAATRMRSSARAFFARNGKGEG